MKKKWLTWSASLGLAAGILSFPMTARALNAGDTKVIRGPVTLTPGVNNGQPGSWSDYTDYTYRYNPIDARLQQLAAGSGLSQGDLNAIAALFRNAGTPPTDAQLSAKIQEVASELASNQRTPIWWYEQAGEEAIQLAKSLGAGQNGYRDYQWGGQVRGWPLEAAMIHHPEMGNLDPDLLLQAWDEVWANVQAHGWSLGDPLVLDLNGNGRIDVTGKSSAKFRKKGNDVFTAENAVRFDLLGTGSPVRTEWIHSGDGFLVDNRNNVARKLAAAHKNLTIHNLFGDTKLYPGGFAKLAKEFDSKSKVASARGSVVAPGLGILKGKELENLLVWIDNGDGKVAPSELHTLKSLGITEIRLPAHFKKADGEFLEQATFVRNGKPHLIQEVWFAHEDASAQ